MLHDPGSPSHPMSAVRPRNPWEIWAYVSPLDPAPSRLSCQGEATGELMGRHGSISPHWIQAPLAVPLRRGGWGTPDFPPEQQRTWLPPTAASMVSPHRCSFFHPRSNEPSSPPVAANPVQLTSTRLPCNGHWQLPSAFSVHA